MSTECNEILQNEHKPVPASTLNTNAPKSSPAAFGQRHLTKVTHSHDF